VSRAETEFQGSQFDYSGDFGLNYHGARRVPKCAEQWIATIRAQKLRGLINPIDRVLEYGVGFGWNLASVQCREKIGFDLAEGLRALVESKGIRFVSNEDFLGKGEYDVVVCHHVLEHVQQPVRCLHRINRLLSSGGRLLLFVPFEKEGKYRSHKETDRAHHLHSWSPLSLKRLAQAAGFRVVSTDLFKFRFDRMAALLTSTLRGGFALYKLIRSIAVTFLPEYEIRLIATKERGLSDRSNQE
jgi:SAM-dependent methyltransferase